MFIKYDLFEVIEMIKEKFGMKRILYLFSCICSFAFILTSVSAEEQLELSGNKNELPEHLVFGIPCDGDLILNRKGFSLGYSKKRRQALWVSYILTAEQCASGKVKRSNTFKMDPAVRYKPVRPGDYKGSGFDKGHLAPAKDMASSVESMKNSFFMTNISPQLPGCNRGIWKRLETQVRRWAVREGKICIITGPVFKKRNKRMKESRIPIPYAFYKVVLDLTPPMKMIAFVIPNETSKRQLPSFSLSVDSVEKLTGYDFFSNLDDRQEDFLESHSDYTKWQ